MAHSTTAARKLVDRHVSETAKGAGVRLTVEVTVYDSGVIHVNGQPVNWGNTPGGSPGAWLSVIEMITACLTLFYKEHVSKWQP
jgi:hypothetical protein